MDTKEYDKLRHKRIETIVIIVLTIFSFAAFFGTYDTDAEWVVYPVEACLAIEWTVYLTKFKNYEFRSTLSTVLSQIGIVLYIVTAEDPTISFFASIGLIIMIGLYERPKLLWFPSISTAFTFTYHIFVTRLLTFDTRMNILGRFMEVSAMYLAILVMRFLIVEEQKTKAIFLETIDELEQTQRSKDDFLANVSHELRTPINTICGMSDIGSREEISEEGKARMRDINYAGRNLLSVVTDILDFSELESGKLELIEDTYNITSTINDIINMVQAKKGDKDILFMVDCDPTIPYGIKGDELKIRRAILSLMDNAVKFTNSGYILLKVGYRREEYGINLIITIKDTGIGMRPESLKRIFTGFSQIDGKRDRQASGVGIGLSIVQALMSILGGVVSVESEYGKGTEVRVVIPQTVVEDRPIAALNDPENACLALFATNDRFPNPVIRAMFIDSVGKMAQGLKAKGYMCSSYADLKTRVEGKYITHVFMMLEDYLENKQYLDELSSTITLVVLLNPGDEQSITNPRILQIYNPMYVLPVVNAINSTSSNATPSTVKDLRNGEYEIPDAHIMVVDDSIMNIKVVEGLLRPYKIQVTTAASGFEAIEKITSKDYDFIFMDHMMPEMDGVECFHRIRSMDNQYYKTVPIIALTANAVAGMREMFIKEGFDDFVSKPIELSALDRVLRKFISEEKFVKVDKTLVVETPANVTTTAGGPLIIGDLDVKKGLLYCGSEDSYIDILKIHQRDGESNRDKILKYFDEADWDNYTILVHALKSSMMSIGAENLSNMAKALELAGKNRDITYIENNTQPMIDEYNRVIDILKNADRLKSAEISEDDMQELRAVTDEEFENLISRFEDAAYTFEPSNMLEVIEGYIEAKFNGHALKSDIESIIRKIKMADYLSAVDTLTQIRDKFRNR